MVILTIFNNILLSLFIALGISFLYSYIFYKTFSLLTSFSAVYKESFQKIFIPLWLYMFFTLTVSLWLILLLPILLCAFFFLKKVMDSKRKAHFNKIKEEEFRPFITEWITKQQSMKISNYSIIMKGEKEALEATIFLYIESGLDNEQIKALARMLPSYTVIRAINKPKKKLIRNVYQFAEE